MSLIRLRLQANQWGSNSIRRCMVSRNPGAHYFDTGLFSNSDTASLNMLSGALFTCIWGCHTGDYLEGSKKSLAQAYVFGRSHGIASLAAVRSIGTEYQEILVEALRTSTIDSSFKGRLPMKAGQSNPEICLCPLLRQAMLCAGTQNAASPCNPIGKALEPLAEESGIILVLLTAH